MKRQLCLFVFSVSGKLKAVSICKNCVQGQARGLHWVRISLYPEVVFACAPSAGFFLPVGSVFFCGSIPGIAIFDGPCVAVAGPLRSDHREQGSEHRGGGRKRGMGIGGVSMTLPGG
ncbi:hypothetical protein [Duganella sp. Leaf126]|uniref:hypothetical protein n=1 Tax=Duganella sp. Leaf126 TaxID=1736266 RepID=UPI0012E1ED18|nr:hypothetical protein [Duganella sp. Leaf126]